MNNVNVQEMEKLVFTIQRAPDQARRAKRVTGFWAFEHGDAQSVRTLEYAKGTMVLNGELPPFAGGWGTSPDPVQYCHDGLATCFAATSRAIRLPVELGPGE